VQSIWFAVVLLVVLLVRTPSIWFAIVFLHHRSGRVLLAPQSPLWLLTGRRRS
jgi:hypothetical protein